MLPNLTQTFSFFERYHMTLKTQREPKREKEAKVNRIKERSQKKMKDIQLGLSRLDKMQGNMRGEVRCNRTTDYMITKM